MKLRILPETEQPDSEWTRQNMEDRRAQQKKRAKKRSLYRGIPS